jgi:acyl-CoA thioester hydrolase
MELPITYRGTVYPWHCDHMGHMNVMWYVSKLDEATWNFLASIGITPAYLRDSNRGMVAVEQRLSYKRELLAGDTVFVRSQLLELRDKAIIFAQEMFNGQTMELAATAHYTGVHTDRTTRKACPFPPEVRAAVRQATARQEAPEAIQSSSLGSVAAGVGTPA